MSDGFLSAMSGFAQGLGKGYSAAKERELEQKKAQMLQDYQDQTLKLQQQKEENDTILGIAKLGGIEIGDTDPLPQGYQALRINKKRYAVPPAEPDWSKLNSKIDVLSKMGGFQGGGLTEPQDNITQPSGISTQPNTMDSGLINPSVINPTRQDLEKVPKSTDVYGRTTYGFEKTAGAKAAEQVTEQITKAQGKRLEEASFGDVAFGQVTSMLRNLVAQLKGKQEEQGGLGKIEGIKGQVMGGVLRKGEFARTQAFEGQRVETALRLNRIVTGQNRVIRSVIDMIYMTLPDRYDSEEIAAQKIEQSLVNAYRLIKTYEKLGYTPEKLSALPSSKMQLSGQSVDTIEIPGLSPTDIQSFELTETEKDEIDKVVDSVLAEKPVEKKKFIKSDDFITTPSGNKYKIVE